MEVPTAFAERLRHTFDGRLRLRWSVREKNWHVEQKVGHGFALAPARIEEDRDDLICARDGYFHIMTITPGDRMPCPKCEYKLRVPVMEIEHLRCPYCQLKGRATRVFAGYWPLDDNLIRHLQKIDPLRGASEALAAEADRHNALLMETLVNDAVAPGLASAEERYNRMVGIAQVGRTMKENSWDHK
jgi:hypothetical protein